MKKEPTGRTRTYSDLTGEMSGGALEWCGGQHAIIYCSDGLELDGLANYYSTPWTCFAQVPGFGPGLGQQIYYVPIANVLRMYRV